MERSQNVIVLLREMVARFICLTNKTTLVTHQFHKRTEVWNKKCQALTY